MKQNKILIYFLFPVVLLLFSQIFRFADSFFLCVAGDQTCAYQYYESLSRPLFIWGKVAVVWAIIVVFLNPVFSSFSKKFALVYLILSAVIIGVAPASCGGFFVCFQDKDTFSWLTSIGFLVITLILIISQKLKSKSGKN